MKDIKTDYNPNHFHYHRTDPWKNIPFEDEKEPESSLWFVGVMCLAAAVVLSYVLGFITAA